MSHDADDGLWQLIGASDANPAKGKLSHLHHTVEPDLTLLEVLDLEPGESAIGPGPGDPWTGEAASSERSDSDGAGSRRTEGPPDRW